MKSPKSLALLTLALACGSIYGADDSAAASSSSNNQLWFNIAPLATPTITQSVKPSWLSRVKGFAVPTIVGAAVLGAGYLSAKNSNSRTAILAATSSTAFLCGSAAALYGLNQQKEIPHAPKSPKNINTALQKCTDSISKLNRNDTYAADQLIDHIIKQPDLANVTERHLTNPLVNILNAQDAYDRHRYETQTLPIKKEFINIVQTKHPEAFSSAHEAVSKQAIADATNRLNNYATIVMMPPAVTPWYVLACCAFSVTMLLRESA